MKQNSLFILITTIFFDGKALSTIFSLARDPPFVQLRTQQSIHNIVHNMYILVLFIFSEITRNDYKNFSSCTSHYDCYPALFFLLVCQGRDQRSAHVCSPMIVCSFSTKCIHGNIMRSAVIAQLMISDSIHSTVRYKALLNHCWNASNSLIQRRWLSLLQKRLFIPSNLYSLKSDLPQSWLIRHASLWGYKKLPHQFSYKSRS